VLLVRFYVVVVVFPPFVMSNSNYLVHVLWALQRMKRWEVIVLLDLM